MTGGTRQDQGQNGGQKGSREEIPVGNTSDFQGSKPDKVGHNLTQSLDTGQLNGTFDKMAVAVGANMLDSWMLEEHFLPDLQSAVMIRV